jgi:hypothetical protein
MSKSKRTPIDYTPQYAEGIFRPKEVVEDELASDIQQTPADESQAGASTRARTHARTSRGAAKTDGPVVDELYRVLQQKQRLASSTFRFQPQELETLDTVTSELAGSAGAKVSKNDVVRLALNWLLIDYREHGEQSMLGRVLQRV